MFAALLSLPLPSETREEERRRDGGLFDPSASWMLLEASVEDLRTGLDEPLEESRGRDRIRELGDAELMGKDSSEALTFLEDACERLVEVVEAEEGREETSLEVSD